VLVPAILLLLLLLLLLLSQGLSPCLDPYLAGDTAYLPQLVWTPLLWAHHLVPGRLCPHPMSCSPRLCSIILVVPAMLVQQLEVICPIDHTLIIRCTNTNITTIINHSTRVDYQLPLPGCPYHAALLGLELQWAQWRHLACLRGHRRISVHIAGAAWLAEARLRCL